MQIESIATSDAAAQSIRSGPEGLRVKQDQGLNKNKQADQEMLTESDPQDHKDPKVSPSEVLDKIRQISEDGLYSVRFEKSDKLDEFIVKIVNPETDEVIRQIPPEDILGAKAKMMEFTGNIVRSEG
jgi:flagellar protein FlaG